MSKSFEVYEVQDGVGTTFVAMPYLSMPTSRHTLPLNAVSGLGIVKGCATEQEAIDIAVMGDELACAELDTVRNQASGA